MITRMNEAVFISGCRPRRCCSIYRGFNADPKRRSLELWLIAVIGLGQVHAPAEDRGAAPPAVQANRIVPQVEPPSATLAFSERPTSQELFRARIFEEPLVSVGGEASPAENVALAAALRGYTKRSGPDDFSSLTEFLTAHPQSPWRASLLFSLGLEYYNTAHYSLALDAWRRSWALAKNATDPKAKAIADRAAGELACMYARLGRMNELVLLC
jgi:hypothetical protein